jgi:hypothetical protein
MKLTHVHCALKILATYPNCARQVILNLSKLNNSLCPSAPLPLRPPHAIQVTISIHQNLNSTRIYIFPSLRAPLWAREIKSEKTTEKSFSVSSISGQSKNPNLNP